MRVIFMGTPEFAVPSLEHLVLEHEVAAVYVRPDAVSGRGGLSRPSAVKSAALGLGLEIRQPPSFRDTGVLGEVTALEADVICVAAYGLILPPAVLDASRHGAINVHASLLPRWRGAAPIQRAILAGDDHVGVSIMRMEEGLDTGPYCLQSAIPAGTRGAVELTTELGALGAELLIKALPGIADGSVRWIQQPESEATYASKVSKDEVAPNPDLSAKENLLRIRASLSAAPARVLLGGKGVTLVAAVPTDSPEAPKQGAVQTRDDGIELGTTDGAILVIRVKPDGKGEMDAASWARGARLGLETEWRGAR